MIVPCAHSLTPQPSTPCTGFLLSRLCQYLHFIPVKLHKLMSCMEKWKCTIAHYFYQRYLPYSFSHRGFCDEATLNPDHPLGIKLICSCSPSRPPRVYSHAKNWEQEGEDRGIRLCRILKYINKVCILMGFLKNSSKT